MMYYMYTIHACAYVPMELHVIMCSNYSADHMTTPLGHVIFHMHMYVLEPPLVGTAAPICIHVCIVLSHASFGLSEQAMGRFPLRFGIGIQIFVCIHTGHQKVPRPSIRVPEALPQCNDCCVGAGAASTDDGLLLFHGRVVGNAGRWGTWLSTAAAQGGAPSLCCSP